MATSGKIKLVTFVTGNPNKLRELNSILLTAGLSDRVVNKDIDLPELQGLPEMVAREKCRLAAERVGGPVLVEDTSLCFNALGGLPGCTSSGSWTLWARTACPNCWPHSRTSRPRLAACSPTVAGPARR
ncbi:hypothetical protein BOX15_Mlig015606g1 [Macrostomum lignano]|uniref:Uncharacterized protein n=1 Tax=Macrostomum lignano TaxID=282301 RepID=A0A267EE56_9PLAT|nr:hypothetical protein BOX15_Mlig015606g1 [Macrostomum lignano]